MSYRQSEKLFISLTDVNDEFIYEAQMAMKTKNISNLSKRIKLFPMVACLVLLLLVTSVFTLTDWGTYIIDMFTSRTEVGSDYSESGFDLGVNVEKISIDMLTGEIQKVPDIIRHQFETYDVYSSWYPGNWQKQFESLDEAFEFIGFDELSKTNWEFNEEQVILNVLGNDKGEILTVRLESLYIVDDIRLQNTMYIMTEYDTEAVQYGSSTTENVEFEEEFYETINQLKCHIISSSQLASGYMSIDGFLVKKGALYNLHIAFKEEDKEQAKRLLLLWADSFE